MLLNKGAFLLLLLPCITISTVEHIYYQLNTNDTDYPIMTFKIIFLIIYYCSAIVSHLNNSILNFLTDLIHVTDFVCVETGYGPLQEPIDCNMCTSYITKRPLGCI